MEVSGTLTALSAVDYRVEIRISRALVETRLRAEIQARRHKLPLPAIRRKLLPVVGNELVLSAFEEEVRHGAGLDVLGEPRIIAATYTLDGKDDLVATVQFAVKPIFDLARGSLGPITRFVRSINNEDIDAELERRRVELSDLTELGPAEPATADDLVHIDLQPISPQGEPLGPRQEGAEVFLKDPRLPRQLTQALIGHTTGERLTAEVPVGGATERYDIEVKRVFRRILPALDEAFVERQTGGAHRDLDRFRETVKSELEDSWQRQAQKALQEKMKDRFIELHEFAVPETLVESALDNLVERELRAWTNKREFDEDAVRARNRAKAERTARWQVVRARLIAEENLEAREEDFEAEYQAFAGDNATVESVRADFACQPALRRRIAEKIVDRRVFIALSRRFEVVEKSREDIMRERGERLTRKDRA